MKRIQTIKHQNKIYGTRIKDWGIRGPVSDNVEAKKCPQVKNIGHEIELGIQHTFSIHLCNSEL
jgi:hypothetical protein